METKYKINLRYQLLSIREGLLFVLVYGVFLFALDLYTLNRYGNHLDSEILRVSSYFVAVFFAPALFLHLTYFVRNYQTELIVGGSFIFIKLGDKTFNYRLDDLSTIEKDVGIYYKYRADKQYRRSTPWTRYGYIKMKFKDSQEFIFTSLMLDPLKFELIPATTKFRVIPYITERASDEVNNAISEKRKVVEDLNKEAQAEINEKITEFKNRFLQLDTPTLKDKINNANQYENEAITAAKEILAEREKSAGNIN